MTTEQKLTITYGNGEIICPACGDILELIQAINDYWDDIGIYHLMNQLDFSIKCSNCNKIVNFSSPPRILHLSI